MIRSHNIRSRYLAIAAFLLCCCTRALAADLPGPNIPDGLGVNIHFLDPRPGEMEMLADGGFRWVRMDFSWSAIEHEKGKYDFSAYDRLMAALEKHHIRAIFILDYSNRHYDRGQSPSSDEGRRAMARWAAVAARHFRGRGIVWEMYNEPNIQFWRPKPNVGDYTRMALEVGGALETVAPEELFVGPATSTFDFKFLEKCFQAGLLKYWSAVTIHPYRAQCPETAAADYARLRQLIDRYAPRGKKIPIISSEWGYSAVGDKSPEVRQGKFLPREWMTNLACGVPISIWYDWHDDGSDPKEAEHHFGTVRRPYDAARQPVYEEKPAYTAARTFATLFEGFHFQKRLPQASPDDYVFVFAKGDQRRYAVWTSAKEHAARIRIGGGQWEVVDHLGEKRPALSATASGLTIKLLGGPLYLTRAEKKAE